MNFRSWLKNRWLLLGAVLALGVTLRFILLPTVPDGYFHDEAWSAAKAWSVVSGEIPLQVYFPENNGMDALHVYLIAALFAVTGPLAIGSRLASAFVGVLTIPATYWFTLELLHDDRQRDTLALIAAFVIAILFPAIAVSRSGWHAISMAWLSITCLAMLSRGLRMKRRRWFVASGAVAGLAQYSYPSARFLPVLLIGLGVLAWRADRAARHSLAINFLWLIVAAAIVFAPLAVFFIQQPEWFFVRAEQTTNLVSAAQHFVDTLLGLLVRGDMDNLHNLPGRPVLDPILSVFFVVGCGVGMARRRFAHNSLMASLLVLSLPVILTGPSPLTRRWTGAMPIVAIIVAVGVVTIAQFVHRRWRASHGRAIVSIGLSLALVASAAWSVVDYFGPYAVNPQLFWAYDNGITQVANYIRTRSDATIFLTPYDRSYEVVAMTLAEAHRAPIQSYNGMACVLFPEMTDRVTEWIVVNEKDQSTLPAIRQLFPNNQVVWRLNSPVGPYARALQVPAGEQAQLQLAQRAQVEFGGKLQLIGFDRPVNIRAGQTLRVKLAIEDRAPLDQLYTIFVHLRRADGAVATQDDHPPCAASLNEADWRPGNIVQEDYVLPIPNDLPRGPYQLFVGVYAAASGVRLPVTAANLSQSADDASLGTIEVR
jgi:hypothetical protein